MSNVETLTRQVFSWNVVENSSIDVDIPRVGDIESIQIELSGSTTLTVAGTLVRAEAPFQLIPRVSFVADGKDVLDDGPGSFFGLGTYKRAFWKSVTAPAAATVSTQTVRAVMFLDRENVAGWRPKDTTFQAWLTKLLQIKIYTGAATDLYTGTPTGTFTGTIKVIVHSFEEQMKQDGSIDKGEPKQVIRRTFQTYNFSAANSAQKFNLPVGNHVRLVAIHATDNVNARSIGEPSDTLVNNVKFTIDVTDVRHNLSWKATRDANAADMSVPLTTVPTGFVVVDSSLRGKASDYYDLTKASTAELELDLAAPTTLGRIEIVTEEFIF